MIVAILPGLVILAKFFIQFRRGDIIKEQDSDMVIWKVRSRPVAIPKTKPIDVSVQKKHEHKADLVEVLKILLKEGEKGVRLQTLSDKMGTSQSKVQQAMKSLIEKRLVDEVVAMSGTKYYLTQLGIDYCRRKTGNKI